MQTRRRMLIHGLYAIALDSGFINADTFVSTGLYISCLKDVNFGFLMPFLSHLMGLLSYFITCFVLNVKRMQNVRVFRSVICMIFLKFLLMPV